MATVHSYARFSSSQQSKGDSERRQLQNGEQWVCRSGHEFSDLHLIDRGKSGFKGNQQKALEEFVKAVQEGVVKAGDILLVEAIDRLGRKGIRQTQTLLNFTAQDRKNQLTCVTQTHKYGYPKLPKSSSCAVILTPYSIAGWTLLSSVPLKRCIGHLRKTTLGMQSR